LGTWSFEHEDKVKIKLDDFSIGVTLIEPKMVNIKIEHPDIQYQDIEYRLGLNNGQFGANYASLRSVSPESAVAELSDLESIPDLRCHFAGELTDDTSLPWIKFNLERDYYVRSLKIFNMKNGYQKSNLEGARFYVGETLCAVAPLELPENTFIEIVCVDPFAEPSAFGEESSYNGAEGNFVKIESPNLGVIVACNVKLNVQYIDPEFAALMSE